MDTPETDIPEQDDAPWGAPLLNLDTLITRPAIMIDGQRFEILSPDELSILDSHRFGQWGRRIQQLADAEGDDAEAELVSLVDRVARRVSVGVPDEVYAGLSGAHKQAISDVFTGLLLRNRLGVAGAIAKAAGVAVPGLPEPSLPTGERQFLASSGSTGKARSGGWLKRLRLWFGRT